jgi:hypothetical protein
MGSVLAGESMTCEESDASGHNGPWEFGNSLDEGGNTTVWWVCGRQVGGLETRGLSPRPISLAFRHGRSYPGLRCYWCPSVPQRFWHLQSGGSGVVGGGLGHRGKLALLVGGCP